MYCEFYGFREKPFTITPNPRFIFLSKNHREAFAHLLYGIDTHAGFIELTGEVGTGKTTVLRTLFEQLDERGIRTALIFNPCLSAQELMRSINREFGIPSEGLNSSELLDELNRFLLAESGAGRTVVLVIDEAQNLEPQVLEQVRLISNLETKTDKLIQIVLAGQPELKKLLGRTELRQLAQRITVSYHLTPLDVEDTTAYIEHRLEVAGDWRAAVFSPQALKGVFRWSGGTPRLINILCDRALLFGYVAESREISGRMVKGAIAEIRRKELQGGALRRWGRWFVVPALLAAAVAFASVHLSGHQSATTVVAAPDNPRLLARELAGKSEAANAMTAFNALAKVWNAPPLEAAELKSPRDLPDAAARRGLTLTRFNGSLGLLVRTGYPALLELTLPGVTGKRYLALTGLEEGRLRIAPQLPGLTSLSNAELESSWSGVAWIPWKNVDNLPATLSLGSSGKNVGRLQQLLCDARAFDGAQTGVFGKKTAAAVRKFQEVHGLDVDGVADARALLLLYREGGKVAFPRLANQGGNERQ